MKRATLYLSVLLFVALSCALCVLPDNASAATSIRAYIANRLDNTVSVIDTSNNTVTATVAVGTVPQGVAVNPVGTRLAISSRFPTPLTSVTGGKTYE